MDELMSGLREIFREVFEDDGIELSESTVAEDIEEWDSLNHVNLIVAIEGHFGVRFSTAEIAAMKGEDQNIGTMLALLREKLGR